MSGIISDNTGRSSGLIKGVAAPSSDYVKIASTNASGSAATIDVDNCFDDTTYNNYHITWDNISFLTGGNSQIYFRLLDASGSVLSGSDYRGITGWSSASSSSDTSGENRIFNGTYWWIHYDQVGQFDTNYQPFIGEMIISQPHSTTWKCSAIWQSNSEDSAGGMVIVNHGTGIYQASPIAHRGIRMYTDSGANFHTDGIISVYGRK